MNYLVRARAPPRAIVVGAGGRDHQARHRRAAVAAHRARPRAHHRVGASGGGGGGTSRAMTSRARVVADRRHHARARSRPRSIASVWGLNNEELLYLILTTYSTLAKKQRHFGDREDPGRSRCLGIFNLGRRTTEEEFRRIFERYGRLEKCSLVYDQKRDQSRGFGFVTYEHVEDAVDAKKDATGLDIHGHQ